MVSSLGGGVVMSGRLVGFDALVQLGSEVLGLVELRRRHVLFEGVFEPADLGGEGTV